MIPSDCKQYDFWIAAYPYNDNGTIQERLRQPLGQDGGTARKDGCPGIHGNVDMDVFIRIIREETSMYSKNDAINRVISIASGKSAIWRKALTASLTIRRRMPAAITTLNIGGMSIRLIRGRHGARLLSPGYSEAFDQATAAALLKHWPYVYCPTLAGLFTQYANPEVGDIVIFYRGGTFAHTGIVTAVNGDKFTTY